jgi:hypothetical protein
LSRFYWNQVFEVEGAPARRRFLIWAIKGLLVPALLWGVVNCGLLPGLPGFLLAVVENRARGGPWVGILFRSFGPVLLLVSSFWAAVTFGWLLSELTFQANDRRELAVQCGFFSLFLAPLAGLIFYVTGLSGLGIALLVWLMPLVHCALPLEKTRKAPPSYARAVARIKFGKYKDAEREVLQELEKSEDNVEGWLMLADLYANHFNDLSEADRTVRELCGQPNVPAIQVSLALHRLADWHLNQGNDPAPARSALEEVCLRLPGTHFARMARQRINQLPATREDLREKRKTKTFKLPALSGELDDALPAPPPESDPREARAQADRRVERLRRNPNDTEAREQFATILAERLGEADLAVEQLDLLLALPDQPVEKSAEWLARSAVWQMKYRQDPAAARVRLEQLVREFPQTPQAFAAQRRLNLMEMEERFRRARAAFR